MKLVRTLSYELAIYSPNPSIHSFNANTFVFYIFIRLMIREGKKQRTNQLTVQRQTHSMQFVVVEIESSHL